ncbi:MAG: hypothetical protein V4697_01030 [Patescibacteria group bacterium]
MKRLMFLVVALLGVLAVTTRAQSLYFESVDPSSPWLAGERRSFYLSWQGFDPGDTYRAHINLISGSRGEKHGFILSEGTFDTETGVKIVEVRFPTLEDSIFLPQFPSIPVDGDYVLFCQESRTGTSWQSSLSLILDDLRIRPKESGPEIQAHRGEVVKNLSLLIDGRFSSADVRLLKIPIVFRSFSGEEIRIRSALYEGDRRVSPWKTVNVGSNETRKVFRIGNAQLAQGAEKELTLHTKIVRGTGSFQATTKEYDVLCTARGKKKLSISMFGGEGPLVKIDP